MATKTKGRPKKKVDVYAIVTERIIEALDAGTVPWHQPWTNRGEGGHRNLESKRSYRGINQLLLQLTRYESPWWTTFEGAKRMGGHVSKGESSTIVVFFRQVEVDDRDTDDDKKKKIPLLRYYRIWNVEQTEGLEDRVPEPPPDDVVFDPVARADKIIGGYPSPAPLVKHGGDGAFYGPTSDVIGLPSKGQFEGAADYYATAFHELTHSTGHPKRLARDLSLMGTSDYSKEELVAEIGAAMLCAEAGIDPLIDRSAAYIDHWRSKLVEDPKLIVSAAAKAQRSCDFILGVGDDSE